MIQVLRGESSGLEAACLEAFHSARHGLWVAEPADPKYWSAFRTILPQLRRKLGADAVDEALESQKIVASLILGKLRETLDPAQTVELEALAAKLTSHLTHNWYLDRPVMFGVVEILNDLFRRLEADRFTLVIPDLTRANPLTAALCVNLYRRYPETAPHLVIGFRANADNFYEDEHGLAWGYREEQYLEIIRAFQALPGEFELKDLEPDLAEVHSAPPRFSADPTDDDIDGRCFKLLAEKPDLLSSDEIDLLLEGSTRAFEAFSRDTAIVLAIGLLDRAPALEPERAALAHSLAGLSAHNWQFETKAGNPRLTEFLEEHFRAALEVESDPARRLALLYRLAVTLGRRKKDFAAAKEFADRAIEEAGRSTASKSERLYHEIWSRNIRAYLWMRLGSLEEAFNDSNSSLELVGDLLAETQSRDAKFTRTTLADNNLTLCRLSGDEELLFDRVRKNIELLEEDPASFGGRFTAGSWIQLFREKMQLDRALACATYGLEDSGHEFIHFRWYYLSQLADLHYRRGEAEKALRYFEETLKVRRYLRPVQDRPLLALPLVAARAGEYERAVEELERALAHPSSEDASTRVEILSLLAILHARRGDAKSAEEKINPAIELAVEEGIRDLLIEVALAAGTVARLLGNEEESATALRRGLEIAAVEGDLPPPSGSIAGLLLGLVELGESDPQLPLRVLRVMPAALLEDPEAWWRMPEFLPRLVSHLENGVAELAPEEREALAILATAAAQRPDCAASVAALHKVMPVSVYQEEMVV